MRTFFEEKNKRPSKKKGLVSEDIYWEKKKDYYKQKIVLSEGTLLGWKKILGKWWGHSLRIKTKGNQRKRVWWVRTSFERKKRLLQTKNCGEWGHTFGMKKEPLENGEDILWREKQKTTKEKKSSEWGHLWREKKRLLPTKHRG